MSKEYSSYIIPIKFSVYLKMIDKMVQKYEILDWLHLEAFIEIVDYL